jgi:cyclopropane fatty-acyl-phospholipid synthase-like methyltransferase
MPWLSKLYRQFGKPEGVLGHLAGWIMASRPSNRERIRWTVELLDLRPDDRVLEIGYGPGLSITFAASKMTSGKVTGIDHSALMHAQASARNAALIRAGRAELRHGGLELLPALPGPFDKVFAVNVFQFIPGRQEALASIRQIMQPDGLLGITYMPRGANAAPGDAGRFAALLSEQMAEAGFRAIRTEKLDLKPMPAVCVLGRV